MNPSLEITGVLACLYDGRLRLAREVLAEIRRHFSGQVYRTAIRCNMQQIQQVIMNILTNACDALNEKYPAYHDDKRIAITAEEIASACSGDVSGPSAGPLVRITIEDRGPGISAAVRERMFDPFFTTKPRDRGTGLGLSISHGIIRDHNGRLSVESAPGQWTRFHIDLPAT